MERTSIWTFTTTRNPSTVRAMLWFGYFFKDGDARLDTHLDQYWCMGRIHDCRRMRLQKLMKNCVDILSMHSNHKTKIYYWSLFIEESLAESVIVYETYTLPPCWYWISQPQEALTNDEMWGFLLISISCKASIMTKGIVSSLNETFPPFVPFAMSEYSAGTKISTRIRLHFPKYGSPLLSVHRDVFKSWKPCHKRNTCIVHCNSHNKYEDLRSISSIDAQCDIVKSDVLVECEW